MTTYYVRLGGSPMDSAERYDTAEDAEGAACRMAREVAEHDGEDPDTVEIYGGEDDPAGWGACPADHDGAYYPEIERREP